MQKEVYLAAKTFITISAATYFGWHILTLDPYTLLSGVNLLVHEAGHIVFSFFGSLLHAAGGSLLQVLIPTAFVYYFWRQQQLWEASVVGYWLAGSVYEVAHYVADAQTQLLPLLGGDTTTHDWHAILSMLGLLPAAQTLGGVLWLLSLAILATTTIMGIRSQTIKSKYV